MTNSTENSKRIEALIKSHAHTQFSLHSFQKSLEKYGQAETAIDLEQFSPLSKENKMENLDKNQTTHHDKVAIVKLNGGLGTSLKCSQTKSLIPLYNQRCLLDYFLDQMNSFPNGETPPVILMNSFYTDSETRTYLNTLEQKLDIDCLVQSRYPRLVKDTLEPYQDPENLELNWNPPGHGELFALLYESGTLEKLQKAGRDYLFISNSDNLGATYDDRILEHMIQKNINFLMEATPKTKADIKGGIIVSDNNRVKLIEIAQVDSSQHQLFFDRDQFKSFNTNNLWVKISSLIDCIKENKLQLDPIFNHKQIKGTPVIQFETAMGSAIQSFDNAAVLTVPRTRFFPIKTVNDVFLLLSDCFDIEDGKIQQSSEKVPERINILNACESVAELKNRFPVIPSLKNCKQLTLEGPCSCKNSTQIHGHVSITCKTPKDIGQHSNYENCKINLA